jgi:hypothetical protein
VRAACQYLQETAQPFGLCGRSGQEAVIGPVKIEITGTLYRAGEGFPEIGGPNSTWKRGSVCEPHEPTSGENPIGPWHEIDRHF